MQRQRPLTEALDVGRNKEHGIVWTHEFGGHPCEGIGEDPLSVSTLLIIKVSDMHGNGAPTNLKWL
jgi:hypothetical protein